MWTSFVLLRLRLGLSIISLTSLRTHRTHPQPHKDPDDAHNDQERDEQHDAIRTVFQPLFGGLKAVDTQHLRLPAESDRFHHRRIIAQRRDQAHLGEYAIP